MDDVRKLVVIDRQGVRREVEGLDPDRLVPPTEEAIERLDDAFDVQGTSRMSRQILMREDINRLVVTLALGSVP